MDRRFLRSLCEAPGVAANEGRVRAAIREECMGYADAASCDGLGSLILTQEGDGPTVMLAAHMDEVGFVVRSISGQGMLMVLPVGSVRTFSRFMQEVCVTTAEGKRYFGMLNAEYDHSRKEADGLYVDIGRDTFEEAAAMGIRPGDMVTFSSGFREYGDDRFAARALDDRAGCYVLGELMKRLHGSDHPNRISYAFTSSEEVGTRGAGTAARVVGPDVCIVLDVACHGNEFVRDHTNHRQLGKGPMLVHCDKSVISNRGLVRLVRAAAEDSGISVQDDMFLGGGTDGGALHRDGAGHPTVVLGIPTRYGHSPYSIACYQDLDDMTALLECLLMRLDMRECRTLFEGGGPDGL